MTAEQFCLRWNNHQRTLISAFDGLFENGTLVDCTLAADGQYLEAHKVVLCACSPYLKMLLSQHYNQHPIVILKDVKFTELQAIVEYIYRGEVNVTQEQLSHFLKAAEMLQVSGLTYRYSENQPEAVGAQIVSSKFSVPSSDSERNVRVVKPKKSKKREKVTRVPVTDINNSLIDSLKLLPSKLVLDIPPISPVNYSKDGSVSPKRKKVSNSGEVKSVDSSSSENKNSESATIDASVVTSDPQFVFEVDPMETEFNTQNIKVEEFSDDSYDSDTLIVDEENAAAATAEGKQQEPGPSGVVADGWSLVAQGVGHPEATKDVGTLAAAMALTRSTAALRAITTIDALRERDRPFVCERCGRHYSVSYTLDRHRKYECGVDKQFFCRKCYRPFSRADSMRVHMRNCLAKLNPSTSTSPSDETL